MGMEALTRMLADGWPLALAGFAVGLLIGSWMSRGKAAGPNPLSRLLSRGDEFSALEAEIKAARELLEVEESEAGEVDDALKSLDEAIKRANGRLKLILKSVKKAE